MGVFDNFPYTNFHSLNLEWIVKDMLKLNEAYDGLKQEIQETIDFINNFEVSMDENIEEHIRANLAYYYQLLTNLETRVNSLSEQLNTIYSKNLPEIQDSINDLKISIANVQTDLLNRIFKLEELMHYYKHSIDVVVNDKAKELEKFIVDNVTSIDRLNVINPITGIYEDIQKVLDDLYDIISRSDGITAEQYDSLQMTAWNYDAENCTAYMYDIKGYFTLFMKFTYDLAWSPFTGKPERISDIINDLVLLHQCPITAQDYDSLELTAEDYDYMQITAFDYDFWGGKIIQPITANNYDNLNLTARYYDNKNITAELYSQGMKALIDMSLSYNCKCNTV